MAEVVNEGPLPPLPVDDVTNDATADEAAAPIDARPVEVEAEDDADDDEDTEDDVDEDDACELCDDDDDTDDSSE